ncbi:uncharacterized protein FTOL_00422 [Fusarium torulosum]|uniref:Uncharacterized protein n=1 Tax=Fusarium torulosum TaxID=33205 RepID=A0AAE8SCV5_9HYPO|nr:uncharacterized protein FTOL_00422 [Fusarium torulosum]
MHNVKFSSRRTPGPSKPYPALYNPRDHTGSSGVPKLLLYHSSWEKVDYFTPDRTMNTSSQAAGSQAANALNDKSVIKEVHNAQMPSLQELKQGQP